ncbi:MAG: SH3 domain-containing protein [Spirochaetales bacterium]
MMRKSIFCAAALLLMIGAGKVPLQAQAAAKAPETMTVQVAKGQIRDAPSVIAPVLAVVEYRTKVLVYESKDGWAKVQVPGSTRLGYMFLSALTEKSISASDAGKAASGVSATEIALAGKGFSDAVEESYRKASHVDYSWVDVMEHYEYSPETLVGFLNGDSQQ